MVLLQVLGSQGVHTRVYGMFGPRFILLSLRYIVLEVWLSLVVNREKKAP